MKSMYFVGVFSVSFFFITCAMDKPKPPAPPVSASPRTPLLSKAKAAADMSRVNQGDGYRAFRQSAGIVGKPAAQKQ